MGYVIRNLNIFGFILLSSSAFLKGLASTGRVLEEKPTSKLSKVNLTSIGVGNAYTWTSPTLPLLMSPGSILPINESIGSWIASLYVIGAAISPIFTSTITETIGFKKTFILVNIFMLLSAIALACTSSVYFLYVGRFLSGFVGGVVFLTTPLYVAETSEDSIRSAMSSTLFLCRSAGLLMELIVGPYVSYHQLIIINSLAPASYLLCTPWMKESPHYLVTKGKREDAIKTVAWLRGGIPMEDAVVITNDIQTFLEKSRQEKKSIKYMFENRGCLKALAITSTIMGLQQLSGVTAMNFYTQQLFSSAGTDISADVSAIIYGCFYVSGSAAAPLLVKTFGCRKPLIISAIIVFLTQVALGGYFFAYQNGYDVTAITWSPIVCTLVFAAVFNCAMGPMPWTVMGEIFPPNIKGQAAAIVTSVCFISAFLTTKYFAILSDEIGTYGVFWLFALASIMDAVFSAIFVPNTNGLSLDQIQDKIRKTKNSKVKPHEDIVTIS